MPESESELRIGVTGAAGRMGRALVRQVTETEGCIIAGATERPGHEAVGRDAGSLAGIDELGVAIGDDPVALFAQVSAVLDFTSPDTAAEHMALAAQGRTVYVVGTTGLTAEHEAELAKAARHTAIVQAPNFSVGVNLMMALTARVAAILDDGYDIEILEMHHRHKVDAPSGTALGLGEAAARGRGVNLDDVAQRTRDGVIGARKSGDIGFATLRGGDVVGEHSVVFAGDGERLEITHKAAGRQIFAGGGVRAALWADGKPPGLYSMADVLGLND